MPHLTSRVLFASIPVLIALCMPASTGKLIAAGTNRQAGYGGVSFSYDPALAGGAKGRIVPEQKEGPNTALWQVHPQHIRFDFGSGPRDEADLLAPSVYVFPTNADYKGLVPDPQDEIWLPRIDRLKTVLSSYPDLSGVGSDVSNSGVKGEDLPYLPPVNAASQYIWKQRYLAFKSGSGVRYVTRFSQDASWVTREGTVYTFQGLTSDRKYYVSVVFPTFLTPAAGLAPPGQNQDPGAYNPGAVSTLNSADDPLYNPSLAALDEMVQSVVIGSNTTLGQKGGQTGNSNSTFPGMPRTGGQAGVADGWGLLLGAVLLATGLVCKKRGAYPT